MDSSELSYYGFNHMLLTFIGLWPYRVTTITYIQRILLYILLLSGVIFQLTTFITHEFSVDFFLEVLSNTILTTIYVIKYTSFMILSEDVKQIIEQIKHNENLLQNESEFDMIRECASQGKQYMIYISLICYSSAFAYIATQFLPAFLDVVAPKNESRPREFIAPIEIFLDKNKYYYHVVFLISITIAIGITTVVSTEVVILMCIQHACGLYRITSDRLQRAMGSEILRVPCTLQNVTACRKIINAIIIHKNAIRFCDLLRGKFLIMYIPLAALGAISLTINLYRLSREALLLNDMLQVILIASVVIAYFFYIFAANFMAQKLINDSAAMFHKIYDSQWYLIPVPAQKLILFLLRKCMDATTFSIQGFYSASLEGFSTIINVSLSYFMILYSTQLK